MNRNVENRKALHRRRRRTRKKVIGTPDRPRLCVSRSLGHIYAQVIEDGSGRVLCSASSLAENGGKYSGNVKSAEAIGELIAIRAKETGVEKVVFDRGGRAYHGRVKALAEAARKGGLEF
ncbi:50S ribosomal protein L18 [Candidatus Hydrogenedentota bacterium]